MNKKGDIPVVLLVFLVLLVVGIALFSFIVNSGKVEAKILDVDILEGVYVKENLIRFYVKEAGEKVLLEISSVNEFEIKFKEEFGKYETGFEDIKVEFEGGIISVGVGGVRFEQAKKDKEGKKRIDVIYEPEILVSFDVKTKRFIA